MSYSIVNVAPGLGGYFSLANDVSSLFQRYTQFRVFNSTGNDRWYVIDSIVYDSANNVTNIYTSNDFVIDSVNYSTNTITIRGDFSKVFVAGETGDIVDSASNAIIQTLTISAVNVYSRSYNEIVTDVTFSTAINTLPQNTFFRYGLISSNVPDGVILYGDYIINFANDSLKTPLIVPPRIKDTTSLDITLVGVGTTEYGESIIENIVHILENFASPTPPTNPTSGEQWYDSTNELIKVWTGTRWVDVGAASAGSTPPTSPTIGQLWYDTDPSNDPWDLPQLKVWNGLAWVSVGENYIRKNGTSIEVVTAPLQFQGNVVHNGNVTINNNLSVTAPASFSDIVTISNILTVPNIFKADPSAGVSIGHLNPQFTLDVRSPNTTIAAFQDAVTPSKRVRVLSGANIAVSIEGTGTSAASIELMSGSNPFIDFKFSASEDYRQRIRFLNHSVFGDGLEFPTATNNSNYLQIVSDYYYKVTTSTPAVRLPFLTTSASTYNNKAIGFNVRHLIIEPVSQTNGDHIGIRINSRSGNFQAYIEFQNDAAPAADYKWRMSLIDSSNNLILRTTEPNTEFRITSTTAQEYFYVHPNNRTFGVYHPTNGKYGEFLFNQGGVTLRTDASYSNFKVNIGTELNNRTTVEVLAKDYLSELKTTVGGPVSYFQGFALNFVGQVDNQGGALVYFPGSIPQIVNNNPYVGLTGSGKPIEIPNLNISNDTIALCRSKRISATNFDRRELVPVLSFTFDSSDKLIAHVNRLIVDTRNVPNGTTGPARVEIIADSAQESFVEFLHSPNERSWRIESSRTSRRLLTFRGFRRTAEILMQTRDLVSGTYVDGPLFTYGHDVTVDSPSYGTGVQASKITAPDVLVINNTKFTVDNRRTTAHALEIISPNTSLDSSHIAFSYPGDTSPAARIKVRGNTMEFLVERDQAGFAFQNRFNTTTRLSFDVQETYVWYQQNNDGVMTVWRATNTTDSFRLTPRRRAQQARDLSLTVESSRNTILQVVSLSNNSSGGSEVYIAGNGQGDGVLYVGQSDSFGGGMMYFGDGNSLLIGNGTTDRRYNFDNTVAGNQANVDHINFFRKQDGTCYRVFSIQYNENRVRFNSRIKLESYAPIDRVIEGAVVDLDAAGDSRVPPTVGLSAFRIYSPVNAPTPDGSSFWIGVQATEGAGNFGRGRGFQLAFNWNTNNTGEVPRRPYVRVYDDGDGQVSNWRGLAWADEIGTYSKYHSVVYRGNLNANNTYSLGPELFFRLTAGQTLLIDRLFLNANVLSYASQAYVAVYRVVGTSRTYLSGTTPQTVGSSEVIATSYSYTNTSSSAMTILLSAFMQASTNNLQQRDYVITIDYRFVY